MVALTGVEPVTRGIRHRLRSASDWILLAGDAAVWRQSTRAQESVPPPFHLVPPHAQFRAQPGGVQNQDSHWRLRRGDPRQPGTAGRGWLSAAGAPLAYGRSNCRSARRNSRNTWSNSGSADIWLARRTDHRAFSRASFFMMASWIPAGSTLRKASFAVIAGTKGARSMPPWETRCQRS